MTDDLPPHNTPRREDDVLPIPATPQDLLDALMRLDIDVEHHHHPPLYTVEDSKKYQDGIEGGHSKNLFLRDRRKNNYLVVAEQNLPIDLKALASTLACDRLSFGSPDRLMEFLGVIPGAVTPFALINDPGCCVKLIVDNTLLKMAWVNFHPLTNDQTLTIRPDDLMRFFTYTGHQPMILPSAQ